MSDFGHFNCRIGRLGNRVDVHYSAGRFDIIDNVIQALRKRRDVLTIKWCHKSLMREPVEFVSDVIGLVFEVL